MYEPRLIYGDFFEKWQDEIIPGSVDLVLVDPPFAYFGKTALADSLPVDDPIDLWKFESILDRVLKPSGLIVMFCNLNLLISSINAFEHFTLWHELVLNKTSGNRPVLTQPIRVHEFVAVFRRAESSPTKLCFDPYASGRKGGTYIKKNVCRDSKLRLTLNSEVNYGDPQGKRWLRSVLNCPSRPNLTEKERFVTTNPFQKPLSVTELLIKVYSREHDLVLDPFAGSATSLIASCETDRRAIGFEICSRYFEEANSRINSYVEEKDTENYLFVLSG